MRVSVWQQAVDRHFGFLLPFDGDGGSGGAGGSGVTTPAASAETPAAVGAAASPAVTTPAAVTPDPPSPSANKLIKDLAAEEGVTVEKLLENYKSLRDSQKTDLEKAQADAAREKSARENAERLLRDATGKAAVITEATKLNALSPNAVYELAKPHLQFDDAGNVTNAAAAIAKVQDAEPKLFAASGGSGDGGATTTTTTARDVKPGLPRLQAAFETSSSTAPKR